MVLRGSARQVSGQVVVMALMSFLLLVVTLEWNGERLLGKVCITPEESSSGKCMCAEH